MKELFLLLVVTGVLGLAPAWYHLQRTVLQKEIFTAGRLQQHIAPSMGVTDISPRGAAGKPIISGAKDSKKPQHPLKDQSADRRRAGAAIHTRTREAIRSFQTNAELRTARLAPEVADQLAFEAPNYRVDP
ncbi:MAG: hypothetical protein ACREQ7_19020 [Candidatus Binatia bacterium]